MYDTRFFKYDTDKNAPFPELFKFTLWTKIQFFRQIIINKKAVKIET